MFGILSSFWCCFVFFSAHFVLLNGRLLSCLEVAKRLRVAQCSQFHVVLSCMRHSIFCDIFSNNIYSCATKQLLWWIFLQVEIINKNTAYQKKCIGSIWTAWALGVAYHRHPPQRCDMVWHLSWTDHISAGAVNLGKLKSLKCLSCLILFA